MFVACYHSSLYCLAVLQISVYPICLKFFLYRNQCFCSTWNSENFQLLWIMNFLLGALINFLFLEVLLRSFLCLAAKIVFYSCLLQAVKHWILAAAFPEFLSEHFRVKSFCLPSEVSKLDLIDCFVLAFTQSSVCFCCKRTINCFDIIMNRCNSKSDSFNSRL